MYTRYLKLRIVMWNFTLEIFNSALGFNPHPHLRFLIGFVLFIIFVFCVALSFCLSFFCVVSLTLPVFLACSFLITPSVFSNHYFQFIHVNACLFFCRYITICLCFSLFCDGYLA